MNTALAQLLASIEAGRTDANAARLLELRLHEARARWEIDQHAYAVQVALSRLELEALLSTFPTNHSELMTRKEVP